MFERDENGAVAQALTDLQAENIALKTENERLRAQLAALEIVNRSGDLTHQERVLVYDYLSSHHGR